METAEFRRLVIEAREIGFSLFWHAAEREFSLWIDRRARFVSAREIDRLAFFAADAAACMARARELAADLDARGYRRI